MNKYIHSFVLLCCTLLALVALVEAASAQFGGSSAGSAPSAEQIKQNMGKMLDDVRAKPQQRSRILDRMKQRMAESGGDNVEARLTEVGKILDEAIAMSAADFSRQRDDLASRMVSQVRGGRSQGKAAGTAGNAGNVVPWIDVHSHLVTPKRDVAGAVSAAAAVMDQCGMTKMIIMPTPHDGIKVKGSDCEDFPSAIRQYGSRFVFLGGGGSLNPMIQQASGQTSVSDSLRRQFEEKAGAILQMGAAGFGEMAIRHLSLQGNEHPYESVGGDHPLYLLLSDIAAKHNVPIDIHLDVVTNDIPVPEWLTSPNNPKILSENLAGFERLLDHNPATKICWEHVGSDNTGHWTLDLSRRLLTKHPNLYMALRLGPGMAGTEKQGRHVPANYPFTPDGGVKPDWLQLFKDFPSRFMIGDDGFIMPVSSHGTGLGSQLASKVPMSRTNARVFLNALPADLAQKIAVDNATVFYKLAK